MAVNKWSKPYWDKHKDEINAKRKAKYKIEQDERLKALLYDYDTGLTMQELCDKYKVNIRR